MIFFGATHKGCVRSTNQDAFAIEPFADGKTVLLVVCDGMGGANAGNVASRFAVDSFVEECKSGWSADLSSEEIGQLLQNGVDKANETVYTLAGEQPEFRGMGTTLVAAFVKQDGSVIVNVGDSRAYCIADGKAKQLTEDHSYVQDLIRKGRLTAEEARRHPHKNLITRAVGVEGYVESDSFTFSFVQGETLLLCSDGLTGPLEDEEIVNIIENADSLETAAQTLIEQACENGGPDNITVVLCRLDAADNQGEGING